MAVGKEQRQQPAGAVVGTLVGRGSCQAERRAQGVETFLFISRPGFEKLPSRTQRLPGLWMRKGNLSGISWNGFERFPEYARRGGLGKRSEQLGSQSAPYPKSSSRTEPPCENGLEIQEPRPTKLGSFSLVA
jgi:hypothetical protein